MKVNTNVSNKTRRELVLDDFKGVDFSSSPLKISGNRASRMSNLICDNGVNHKRPGWEQLLKLGSKINGIYEYNCGGHHALIIYAGKTFYRSVISKDTYDEPENIYENDNLIDQKVQFFLHKERLYIIGCGDYLVYGIWDNCETYTIQRVADAPDTYVPTTLSKGSVLDKVNILTSRRKNMFNQKLQEDGECKFFTDVAFQKLNKLTINGIEAKINSETISCEGPVPKYAKTINYEALAICGCGTRWLPSDINPSDFNYEYSVIDVSDPNNENYEIFEERYSGLECKYCKRSLMVNGLEISYFTASQTTESKEKYKGEIGRLIVADDYENATIKKYTGFSINQSINSMEWDLDITAEFEVYDINGRDYIPYCTFGTVFGAYGNSDRLFLSGNPLYPNADFYSEYDDFTYFTAKSQTVMGSKDVPITGYLRLSDSTLATLKAETNTEPTIYYRTATETEVELENGQKTYDVGFTRWTGGINEGCVNPYCTALFADDNLMLSPNGVRGIVQIANSATNERYVRERDKFINDNLLTHDLTNAVSIVYKNRYYLAVDGVCYVADPRYKTYVKDDIDGSFNYEWWYWENIPARVFAIINGELWFGTEDGRICRFYNAFVDKLYDETVNGQITADGGIMISDEEMDVAVCVGDEIRLGGYNYPLYVVDKDESTFKVSKEKDGDAVTNIVKNIFNDNPPVPINMRVYCYKNVVSEWYSPVFDLGAFDVSKTLLSMSITVDPNVKGRVKFGYSTRDNLGLEMPYSHSEGSFDFDNLNFNYISFDAPFAASRTVRVKVRNFNYIMFKLISDTDEDCAVCNLKAVYQYNGRLKGVH